MKINKLFPKVEGMLYNYNNMKREIKGLDLAIEEVENNYIGITGLDPSKEKFKTNKINSVVENEVVNKEEKIQKLKKEKLYKENQVKKIDNALEVLTERERQIIDLRYFNKMPNWKVACRIDKTEEYTSRLKRESVEKIIPLLFPLEFM